MPPQNILYEVGSPARLVGYRSLPGCFVNPVPPNRLRHVCLAYKEKLSRLVAGFIEISHYMRVVNYFFEPTVFEDNLVNHFRELQESAELALRGISKACQYFKQLPKRFLRQFAIQVANRYTTLRFCVHRTIPLIGNRASNVDTPLRFPVESR